MKFIPLVGGLRAKILSDGMISVGDAQLVRTQPDLIER